MKNGLKKILNRFSVFVIDLQKDRPPEVSIFHGSWKKGIVRFEASTENRKDQCPALVLFTGYGVISKEYSEKTERREKIIQGDEFLWEKTDQDTGQQIVFVRREVVNPWLLNLEKQGLAVVDISLLTDSDKDSMAKRIERTYDRWQRWAYWRKKEKEQQVLSMLLVKRLRLPVLVFILILLSLNYPLQNALRERTLRQQNELTVRQQRKLACQTGCGKTQKMLQTFSARKKLTPLLDRIAALVPGEITLELLAVNPPRGRVEPGKPLVLEEEQVIVEGYSRQTAGVALFTGRLAEAEPTWRVTLARLDYRPEKTDFVFRIRIIWKPEKNYETE